MEIDEFTFPTTNPNNSPIDSPPLWRLSPTASPTPSYKQQECNDHLKLPAKMGDQNGIFYSRKSCSIIERRCLKKRSKLGGDNNNSNTLDEQDDQEKMDMLWEDLNYEDLFRNSECDPRMIDIHGNEYSKGSNEMVEFGCVPTPFKLVRTSNMKSGGTNKRLNLLVFVKVLKRLFVLQQSTKKRSS